MFTVGPLQIEYPENVHLIRGNHEAADINALFGFRLECIERMVYCHFSLDFLLGWTKPAFYIFFFIRERMMGSGRGQDSINFSIIFPWLLSSRTKLYVCMVGLGGQSVQWSRSKKSKGQ